jgi:CRP-like cAMP-binding protein
MAGEVAVKAKRPSSFVLRPSSTRTPASRKERPPPSRNRPPPRGNRNLLLAGLPAADYARLLPALEVIPLKLKDLLYTPDHPIEYVYFPGGGFCSVLTVLKDGEMVEVVTIGREGMVGTFAATDGRSTTSATMVQGETDTCYRMTVDAFRGEMERRGAFYERVTRYGQALVGFIMQSTACNAVHSVEQRLARWLLMAQDRMESDQFALTQEFVAMMLGVTRPTVTDVAGALQKAGLIMYQRGRVTIRDREKLEAASCECYRATTDLIAAATQG